MPRPRTSCEPVNSCSCPPRTFLPALCNIFLDQTATPQILEVTARALTYYLDVSSECAHRIVGVDETDLDRNWVSWLSPIARALMQKKVGQRVPFKAPRGQKELEIVAIEYEG